MRREERAVLRDATRPSSLQIAARIQGEMWGTKKPCPERIELEGRIKQRIDSLAVLAVRGEDTAYLERAQGTVEAYDRLRRDRDVQAAVLASLRECLERHRSWHKC